jgi:hypothetical protein
MLLQVAVGVLACVIKIFTHIASLQAELSDSFFETFANFVRLELEVRYFVDVNTGEYRDHVESLLKNRADRSCETLLHALQTPTPSDVSSILGSRVTLHPTVSSTTLQGLIRDSISAKAPPEGLHFAIAHSPRDPQCQQPLPHGMAADIDHHFLAVWHTRLPGSRTVG